MFTKISKELSKPDTKKLFSNFFSLSVLQVVSSILPLLTIPYLIIVLGIEKFGLVSLAQAVMTYFIVLTDYGFSLSATKDISVFRNNHKKISSIVNSVFSTKLLLGVFSFILFIIILFSVKDFRKEYLFFVYSFSIVMGQLFFPVWFFQGMEQMKYITYLTITAKLIFTGLVFVVIKTPNDYIYVNALQGIGSIVSSFVSIWIIHKKFKIQFLFSSYKRIQFQLKEGWHILLSSLSINIYINSNIIILGFFTNPIVLGYYSIAEKVMFAVRLLLVVFSQAIYPHICKLAKTGHQELKLFFKKIFLPFATLVVMCCVFLFIFSDKIVLIITGNVIPACSTLVKLLSIVPLIVCLNIPAYQTLLAYNLKKSYSLIITIGAALSICLNVTLAFFFQAIGTSVAIIITETFITIGLYLILELKHRQYSLI